MPLITGLAPTGHQRAADEGIHPLCRRLRHSELDQAIEKKFNEIFEREVAVFFVGTGTAANSLALASVARPGGIAFCHSEAHVIEDECGAPIYFSNASRLMPVAGPNGKMVPKNLKAASIAFRRAPFTRASRCW